MDNLQCWVLIEELKDVQPELPLQLVAIAPESKPRCQFTLCESKEGLLRQNKDESFIVHTSSLMPLTDYNLIPAGP